MSLFLYLNEFELKIIATNLSLAYKYKFPVVIIGTAGFQQIVYQHQYIFSIIDFCIIYFCYTVPKTSTNFENKDNASCTSPFVISITSLVFSENILSIIFLPTGSSVVSLVAGVFLGFLLVLILGPDLVACCVAVSIISFSYLLSQFLAKDKKSQTFYANYILCFHLIEYLLICILHMYYIVTSRFLLYKFYNKYVYPSVYVFFILC